MSDSYRSARQIGTAGLTLTTGIFNGFITTTATQTITIAGAKITNANGVQTSTNVALGITFVSPVVGQYIPIRCTHIKPNIGTVIGLLD